MRVIATQTYHSPVGELRLGTIDGALCLCDWANRKARSTIERRLRQHFDADFFEQSDPLLLEAVTQLEAYFDGQRQSFDIPIATAGSEFQNTVWQTLQRIPFGEVWSYSALADSLGNPSAVRAVANANGANALSIFIPCHRVIGKNNALTGYAGGIDAKQRLLSLERQEMAESA